ncbi:hypothetical protein BDV28DRAFT_136056 [Aspergillus coremiiformis]|uniref:Uncharacterized protein n=1 Tax=Aspergillus coremiiformis TaxID=138285 RepID=A0A5N6Z5J6_9EURO|nr:hypothetical protein BDV28DRAFT_136056 [Aspergillus coremiiformis]
MMSCTTWWIACMVRAFDRSSWLLKEPMRKSYHESHRNIVNILPFCLACGLLSLGKAQQTIRLKKERRDEKYAFGLNEFPLFGS